MNHFLLYLSAGSSLHSLPPKASAAELLAYDALGRVVLCQALTGSQGEADVNVQSWPSGLYQLTLVAGKQVIGQQRIAITTK